MKKNHAIVLSFGMALSACGSDDADSSKLSAEGSNVDGQEDGPGAFSLDYASSDEFFTRMDKRVKGASPHGTVRIWYSSNIRSLSDARLFQAPVGTTSIKEFDMDSDGALDGYAVMIKKEAGYDTRNGDWYYEMRGADGELMSEPTPGKISDCIGCHMAAKSTDYLAGTSVK